MSLSFISLIGFVIAIIVLNWFAAIGFGMALAYSLSDNPGFIKLAKSIHPG